MAPPLRGHRRHLEYQRGRSRQGGLAACTVSRIRKLKTRKTDFAPRLGVAWRLNPLTVIRSGYGLTYNPLPFARMAA